MAAKGSTNGQGSPGHAKIPGRVNVTNGAGILGVTTFSFYRWKRKYSDFPQADQHGTYSEEELRAWHDQHPEAGDPTTSGSRVVGRREDLMCDNLEKRNALLDKQLGEADRRLINGDRVREFFIRERTMSLELLRKRLLSEVPAEAEGKRAPVIEQLLDEAINEFGEDLQRSAEEIIRAA